MRIERDIKLDFKDVLIRPKRSILHSRSQVDLIRQYCFLHSKKSWKGIPIIAANMDHTGTFEMAAKLAKQHLLTAIYKFATIDQWKLFAKKDAKAVRNSFVSSGTRDGDFDQLQKILNSISTDFICLDVANGYSQHFVDFIKKTREKFPSKIIMAGNVVTGEMTEELILSGADIVKVGIGPGSVCTTRKKLVLDTRSYQRSSNALMQHTE